MSGGPEWGVGSARPELDPIRAGIVALERRIEAGEGLSPKDLKRLDKAVTVMKVGLKIAKKALREERPRADRPRPELVRRA